MRSALVTTFKTDRLGGGSVWRKDRSGFQPSGSFLVVHFWTAYPGLRPGLV